MRECIQRWPYRADRRVVRPAIPRPDPANGSNTGYDGHRVLPRTQESGRRLVRSRAKQEGFQTAPASGGLPHSVQHPRRAAADRSRVRLCHNRPQLTDHLDHHMHTVMEPLRGHSADRAHRGCKAHRRGDVRVHVNGVPLGTEYGRRGSPRRTTA